MAQTRVLGSVGPLGHSNGSRRTFGPLPLLVSGTRSARILFTANCDLTDQVGRVKFQIQRDHFVMIKIDNGIGDLNDQRTAGASTIASARMRRTSTRPSWTKFIARTLARFSLAPIAVVLASGSEYHANIGDNNKGIETTSFL